MSEMYRFYNKLEAILPRTGLSEDIHVRHAYLRALDFVLEGVLDFIIRPVDAQGVAEILKVANEENVSVITRGCGDCEFGGSKFRWKHCKVAL